MRFTTILGLCLFALITPAEAHHHRAAHHHRHHVRTAERPSLGDQGVIGGRPSGCPHAFCGCGASLYLFGRIIPALNLAANWFRFPRTSPAPRTVAVRNHHVMVLVAPISGNVWQVHDSNSGHHLTRLHARSIAGYIIVAPHG